VSYSGHHSVLTRRAPDATGSRGDQITCKIHIDPTWTPQECQKAVQSSLEVASRSSRALEAPEAETILDAVLRLDTHLLMVDDPVKWLDS
jgi:hypothetical protein